MNFFKRFLGLGRAANSERPIAKSNPSPTYRYGPPKERPLELAFGEEDTMKAMDAWMERWLGKPQSVLHELLSDQIHLDLHLIPPSDRRKAWTVVTTGMSDRPQPGAARFKTPEYTELMISLPPDWPMPPPYAAVTDWSAGGFWPLGWMKYLARFPHQYESALGFGHSLPHGDPPQPLSDDTLMAGCILLPAITLPREADVAVTASGRSIHIFAIHLLTADELQFKVTNGADALMDRFDAARLTDINDPRRKSML